jgi:hypothetical protein
VIILKATTIIAASEISDGDISKILTGKVKIAVPEPVVKVPTFDEMFEQVNALNDIETLRNFRKATNWDDFVRGLEFAMREAHPKTWGIPNGTMYKKMLKEKL